jgi:hypothetical protein
MKPTQYWFIGFSANDNLIFDSIDYVKQRIINDVRAEDGLSAQVRKSEIHPQYANRFIRRHLL